MTQDLTGTNLTAQEAKQIIRSGGNFTLDRIEMFTTEGTTQEFRFDPPYRLRNGEDYAIRVLPEGGAIEVWEIEEGSEPTLWKWMRPALRAGEIRDEDATRH